MFVIFLSLPCTVWPPTSLGHGYVFLGTSLLAGLPVPVEALALETQVAQKFHIGLPPMGFGIGILITRGNS